MKNYNEVVFNGKYMCKKQCRGVQRYTKEVLHAIDEIVPPDTIKVIIPHKVTEEDSFKNIKVIKYGGFFTSKLWQFLGFQLYILKNKAFSVCLSDGVPLFNIGIVAIHDIRYFQDLQKKNTFKVRMRLEFVKHSFKHAIKNAREIITVSEFSKREIMNAYGNIFTDNIHVCYNAWQHLMDIRTSKDILEKNSTLVEGSYYFTLGGSEESKNMYWIYRMVKKYPNRLFVMAGPNSLYFPVENVNLKECSNFLHLGYVSDSELKSLMKYCKAFLFPSKYEGFGIPPMEALSVGAKVIMSNAACLPEIYKNYVSYFNPDDYNVDLDKLTKESNPDVNELLSYYSWDATAKKLLSIIGKHKDLKI